MIAHHFRGDCIELVNPEIYAKNQDSQDKNRPWGDLEVKTRMNLLPDLIQRLIQIEIGRANGVKKEPDGSQPYQRIDGGKLSVAKKEEGNPRQPQAEAKHEVVNSRGRVLQRRIIRFSQNELLPQ